MMDTPIVDTKGWNTLTFHNTTDTTEWARVSKYNIVTFIDVKKCFEGPENQYTALAKAVWNEAIEAAINACQTTGIKHPQQTGQEACELAIRELKK